MLVLMALDVSEGQGRAVPGHAEQGKPVPCLVRSRSLLQATSGEFGQDGPQRDIPFVRKRARCLEDLVVNVQSRPHSDEVGKVIR